MLFAALAVALAFVLWMAWETLLRDRTPIEQANRAAIKERLLSGNASAPGAAKAPAVVKPSAPARAFEPLPPIGAKLVEIYPRLRAEASEGNVRASCRLAFELERCQRDLPRWIQGLTIADAKIAKAETSEARERYEKGKAYTQREIESATDICAGFVDTEGVRPWQYLFNAALAGHTPSMARFALAPPLNPLNVTQDLEGVAAYRTYAPDFLRQAADSGYGPAVSGMVAETSGGLLFVEFHMYGIHLAPFDYELSARYMHAFSHFPVSTAQGRRSRGIIFDKLTAALSPEAMARAKVDGDALAASWKPEVFAPKEGRVPGQLLPKGGYDCNE
ncbi:hypothetical protein BWI17_18375 [Betaproteobacteria bacterium GR16-43]|nr:hypothetical protein BWI17_18375 [Betaproteobacteria bacterium GR16-43]